jgi:uncharacterized protein YecE (DUF72 family)
MPGEVTHERLLHDTEQLVSEFVASIGGLGDKLGPIVVQLAPKLHADAFPTLEAFLRGLPEGRRYAVEFRHRSWAADPRMLPMLRDLGMAVLTADHPWYPRIEEVTCDFVYVRLLGRRKVFPEFAQVRKDREGDLREWVGLIRSLERKVDRAFVFANNQFEGTARRQYGGW